MNTNIIKFDLNKYKLYEKIKAKQGDTKSRFLLFKLLDGSIPFSLQNRSVRAYMIKPDGKEVFNDLIVNNYKLGYCTLELTNQVLAVPGIIKVELMITEEDKKLTSSVFELEVIKSINSEKSIVSTNEFTALLNGLASLSEYDNYKNEIKYSRGNYGYLPDRLNNFDEQLDTITTYLPLSNGLDDTDVINNIIQNSKGIIKCQPNETYLIDAEKSIMPKDGTILDFNNASFKAKTTSNSYYKVINIENVKNIKIINPKIIGDRDTHITSPATKPGAVDGFAGEWGHGINIIDSENIEIYNPKISKCWGDGIYIGTNDGTQNIPKNINIYGDIDIKECRRQGLSVITVDGLYIEDFKASNIYGMAPMCAIDFEPNNVNEKIKNVTVNRIIADNCEYPVQFINFNEIDITINEIICKNCRKPSIEFHGYSKTDCGNNVIKIGDFYIDKAYNKVPIYLHNWLVDYNSPIYINNINIENWINDAGSDTQLTFLYINVDNEELVNATNNISGNLTINNINVKKANINGTFRKYYAKGLSDTNLTTLRNINININRNSKLKAINTSYSIRVNSLDNVNIIDDRLNVLIANANTNCNDFIEKISDNQYKFNCFQFDSARSGCSNFPPNSRGFIFELTEDGSSGTYQLALCLNDNTLKSRYIRRDGTTSEWLSYNQNSTYVKTSPPSTTPTKIGDTYINTATKVVYMSVGTSSASDWVRMNQET